MDTNLFFEKLDKLFAKKDIEGAGQFIDEEYKKAVEHNDDVLSLTILNEMIGYNRDIGNFDKSIEACHLAISLMKKMGIEDGVEYATSLQNIANAHRAAGLKAEALEYFHKVFTIYKRELEPGDYRIASLHNNIALLYQEMGDFLMASEHLKKALSIIRTLEGSEIEVATTLANLAASEVELGDEDNAKKHLEESLEIFRKDKVKNFHYSAALSALAALMCKKNMYEEAAYLYQEALAEIEVNMGKDSQAYTVTKENYDTVLEKCAKNSIGIEEKYSAQKIIELHNSFDIDNYSGESDKESVLKSGELKSSEDINSKNANSNNTNSGQDTNNGSNYSGLELARRFYEDYGRVMIHERFEKYEDKIAVGLCGEGSEVFGYDDELSRDHDFGPGFCMWLPDDLYDEIGESLAKAYDELPDTYLGVKRLATRMAEGRLGVWRIGDFFEQYTGYREAPKTEGEWIEIEDYKLATVTNGLIFRDDLKEFTKTRQGFMRQPPLAYRVKLARVISSMAQTGQCNYARSMARKDYVTAHICISKFMEATMQCIYMLNDAYSPYYKWLLKGTKTLEILPEVGDFMRALADTKDQRDAWEGKVYANNIVNEDDQKAMIVEMTAKLILDELRNQGLIKEIKGNFLGDYVHEIYGSENSSIMAKLDRDAMIKEIVALEFEAFDKVENIDGRADCQDDWPYFNVMRRSQYMTWPDRMLEKYLELLKHNKQIGWNIITEKYARMMESTDIERYKELENQLPARSEQDKAVVNQIAEIQVGWMEDFSKKYPLLASQARDISSSEDEMYNTSYETYLKGELLTYNSELIKLYGEWIVSLYKAGKNLAEMTIRNTALLQGYKSLEEAEDSIKKRS